nr:MoaD/ThiS family protein [Pseudoalteromonas sp. MMG010]
MFFGQLKERLNCDSLVYTLTEPATIEAIKLDLASQQPNWQPWLCERELLAALNQTMVGNDTVVNSGDELALFPPVTGG